MLGCSVVVISTIVTVSTHTPTHPQSVCYFLQLITLSLILFRGLLVSSL